MKIIRPTAVTDAVLDSTNVAETDYSAWDSGTAYASGDRVIVVATHKIYESLISSNTGNYPPDNLTGTTPAWLEVGATNAWKMFDGHGGTATSNADSINVVLSPGRVNSLALLGLDANSVTAELLGTEIVADGVIYHDEDLYKFSSRSSTATYHDSDGVLQTAAIDQARYTYNPADLTAPNSLLLEEARTNLLTYSEDFNNAAWSKNNVSISANVAIAPDGTLTADRVIEDTTTSGHLVQRNFSVVGDTTYCRSVFAKSDGSARYLKLETDSYSNWVASGSLIVDLSDGSIVLASLTPDMYGVEVLPNGWYRVWVVSTTISSPSAGLPFDIELNNAGISTYTGDGTSGVYIWGAQIEEGAYPTSYIPSTTTQVTRAADIYKEIFYMATSNLQLENVGDWYEYFYEPIVRRETYILTDIPMYENATLEITIEETGGTVECGLCIPGQFRNIGTTTWGAGAGIIDYSRKDVDTFGAITVTERAFSKRSNFDIVVENNLISEVSRLLAEYRATPIVYIGSSEYDSTVIYGFYRDFDTVIEGPAQSNCTIEVEGII